MTKNESMVKRNTIGIVILFAVIFLQLLVIMTWKEKKGGFHTDEYYTMGYTCTFTSENYGMRQYLPDWKEGVWQPVGEVKDYLTFDKQKSVFSQSLMKNAKLLLKRNSYFALLNAIYTPICNRLSISDASIYLNMVLFVILQVLLAKMLFDITNDIKASITGALIVGLSGMTIGLVVYVRFYIWEALLFVLSLYFHYLIWKTDSIKKYIALEILLGLSMYLSYKVFSLMAVMLFVLCIAFSLGLFLRRERKKLLIYLLPIVSAGLFLFIKDGILFNLLDPDRNKKNVHYQNVREALRILSMNTVVEKLLSWYRIFWHQIFGARVTMLVFLLIALLFFGLLFRKKIPFDRETSFVLIMLVSAAIYFVFTVIFAFDGTRYNYFTFIVIAIVLSFFADKVTAFFFSDKKALSYLGLFLCALASLYGSVKIQKNNQIEKIFEGDYEPLECIRNDYSAWDNVVVHEKEKNGYGHVYECIYNSGENTEYIYISENTYEEFFKDCDSRQFLVWTHAGGGLMGKDILLNNGYKLDKIATTHISDVYKCTRN